MTFGLPRLGYDGPAPFVRAGEEPSITELLADPVLHLLLRRDRLSGDDLLAVIEHGRSILAAPS